jgi:hypothetical protein
MIYMLASGPSMTRRIKEEIDSILRVRRDTMEIVQTVSEWKAMILPTLESKADEFQMMGYSRANPEEIWDCLVKKVWKGDPEKRIYEVVQDIFHLGSGTYISYLTVAAYQDDNLFASISALTAGGQEDGG